MFIVKSIEDIKENIKTLDSYLNSKNEYEVDYAKALVKRGTCFVVTVDNNNEYKFYPSRFIGYKNNTMDKHERNYNKDGKETNPAISEVLNVKPVQNESMEEKYKDYCDALGFKPNKAGSFGVPRKYWAAIIEIK